MSEKKKRRWGFAGGFWLGSAIFMKLLSEAPDFSSKLIVMICYGGFALANVLCWAAGE